MYIYFIEATLDSQPFKSWLWETHQTCHVTVAWKSTSRVLGNNVMNVNINECLVLLWLKEIQMDSALFLKKKTAYLKWSSVYNDRCTQKSIVSVDKIFRTNTESESLDIHKVKSSSNISKTSASVSSGVPNTEKLMKARGRRPSAFIVSRCLEPLMKHEARVFDMASQMRQ